jgi:hypothetical protein
MYEVAYTIASDEELAQKWIDHDDPMRPFQPIHRLTRDGLSKLGVLNSELRRLLNIECTGSSVGQNTRIQPYKGNSATQLSAAML